MTMKAKISFEENCGYAAEQRRLQQQQQQQQQQRFKRESFK